jgi:hypothetical protein
VSQRFISQIILVRVLRGGLGRVAAAGNGGRTDRYVWSQQLGELWVNVPVPIGTRSRDLTVDIGEAYRR